MPNGTYAILMPGRWLSRTSPSITAAYTSRSSRALNRDDACKQMVAVQILVMILSSLTYQAQEPLQFVMTGLATLAAEGREGFNSSDVAVDTPRGGLPIGVHFIS